MAEVIWIDPTGIEYKRVGDCIHCGRCCRIDCRYFRWVAVKSIPKGTEMEATGEDTLLRSFCLGEADGTKPESCKNFPMFPQQIRGRCGFNFMDKDGNIFPTPDRSFPPIG